MLSLNLPWYTHKHLQVTEYRWVTNRAIDTNHSELSEPSGPTHVTIFPCIDMMQFIWKRLQWAMEISRNHVVFLLHQQP
jgi:hypothetical protein